MKKGFTLIELLLIALIIGILVSVSLPQVRKTLDNFQTEAFVKDIFYLSRYVQGAAAGESKVYCLNINKVNGEFWVTYKEKDEFKALTGRFSKKYTLPKDVTMEIEPSNKEKIYFYPDGSIDKVTFTFSNQYDKQIHLNIQGSTGQINIE